MAGVVGPVHTHYNDFSGTVALDDQPAENFLLEEAGLHPAEWALVGFELGGLGQTEHGTVYAVRRDLLQGHDGIRGVADDLGAVPVTAFKLPKDRALHALKHAFKEWVLSATYKGVAVKVEKTESARAR